MTFDHHDYEIARPGLKPLALKELRPSMNPNELYAMDVLCNEYCFNRLTLADDRIDNPNRLRPKAASEPVTTFELRTGNPDQSKDRWLLIDTFEDLERAKAALAEIKARNPQNNYALRKKTELLTTLDPAEWARQRLSTGEWEQPIWINEPWVKSDLDYQWLHLSVGEPGNVAYWPSRAAALNDRCAIESAGRYLSNHYSDVLSAEDIARLVYQADPPGELVLSGSDPDAIANVYRTAGIGSCMAKTHVSLSNHPTRVYGAGDLEVMTLVRHGRIIARALCWPERKFVGAIYGDSVRMKIAIDCAGYTRDFTGQSTSRSGGLGGFEGARLLKQRHRGAWLMPYIDLGYRVWDDGEFFRLSRTRGVCVSNTSNVFDGEIPFYDLKEAA